LSTSKSRRKFVAAIVIVVIVIAAGLGIYVSLPRQQQMQTTTTQGTVPNPDSYTWLFGSDVVDLDPATAQGILEETVQENVYETLVWHPHNESLTPVKPLLAESYTISSDGLTYDFILRQGVKFQDGTSFNATAVKFTFDRAIIMDAGPYVQSRIGFIRGAQAYFKSNHTDADVQAYLAANGVEIVNNYEVIFHLQSPFFSFQDYLASVWPSSIMDPSWVMKNGGFQPRQHNLYVESHAMGTGAYMLQEWIPKQRVVLAANPNYWRGQPRLKTITINIVPELATREAQLFAGEADLALIQPNSVFDVIAKDPWVNSGAIQVTRPGVKVALGAATMATNLIHMNQQVHNPDGTIADFQPFQDIRVRHAFAVAFDYDTFIKNSLNGIGQRANSPLPIGTPEHDYSLGFVQYNLTLAKELLTDAGYSPSKPVVITAEYPSDNSLRAAQALILKQGIEALDVGITIDLRPVDVATYSKDIVQKTFQVNFIMFSGAGLLNGLNFLCTYVCDGGVTATRLGYRTPDLNALAEQIQASNDPDKQLQLFYQAQEGYVKTYDVIFIYQAATLDVMRTWDQGFFSNGFYAWDTSTRLYFFDMYKAPGTATVIDLRPPQGTASVPQFVVLPAIPAPYTKPPAATQLS
jgi:peptide/nickel transport system substrate-binding protein